ncbi:MAG: MscL family protein [Armatimonadetes bacterium]|nr:MscL family protein [Armatimonadota bacterium]MDE2205997.1 MscL family protein [Armatimonadota bacterium]
MIQEFKAFLTKTNALALAIAFIIGAATGKVVTAIVNDVLMPIVGLILPKGDWQSAQLVLSKAVDATGKTTVNALKYGDLVGALVDFVAVSLIAFLIAKMLIRPAPAGPPTKECGFCKETVPQAATRCKFCTSTLE